MMADMNFAALSVEIGIAVLMAAVLLLDLILEKNAPRRILGGVTAVGLLAVLAGAVGMYPPDGGAIAFYAGHYIVDGYSIFFKMLFIVGMLSTVLFSMDYAEEVLPHRGEYYVLLLAALLGMCALASANDLMTAFVGLELMTISFYTLVAIRTDNPLSAEAGIKYLVFGSGSTAVLLYGMSLVYGMTGTMVFQGIAQGLGLVLSLGLIGVVFILAGFFFKLSIIPFHLWAPDVYEGAPAPVTALLAMCSKAAGVAILLRVLFVAFPALSAYWTHLMAALACVSMVGGNIMAFRQTNIKRMLAYSSIAHAGFVLIGVSAFHSAAIEAVAFYLLAYGLASVGAFGVVALVRERAGGAGIVGEATALDRWRGLGRKDPFLAGAMAIFLLSFAGIPLTGGFIGKFQVFAAGVEGGLAVLVVLAVLASAATAFFYFRLILMMFFQEPDDYAVPVASEGYSAVAIGVCAVGTLLLGIVPGPLMNFLGEAKAFML